MDALSQTASTQDADARSEPRYAAQTIALWDALDADRRSRDERTARLRAMRLIGGDDGESGSVVAAHVV